MSFFRTKRWLCETHGCANGHSRALFAREVRRSRFKCSGCGGDLSKINPKTRWGRVVCAVFAVAGGLCAAAIAYHNSRPFPRELIVVSGTPVVCGEDDGYALVAVHCRGEMVLDLDYSTVDGSATSPDDYVSVSGTVRIGASAEDSEPIRVPVISDQKWGERREYFLVKVHNVEPEMEIQVFIENQGITDESERKAVAGVVRTVSQDGYSWGVGIYKNEILRELAESQKHARSRLAKTLSDIDRNEQDIDHASQSYVEGLRELAGMDSQYVGEAFEEIARELAEKRLFQQSAVADLARQHFDQLLKSERAVDLKAWSDAIRGAIKRPIPSKPPHRGLPSELGNQT